jgi:hypothetical protein
MNRSNVSFDTLSLHLKRMVYGRILQQKGKYTLTKECRNKMDKGLPVDSKSYKYLNRSIDANPLALGRQVRTKSLFLYRHDTIGLTEH